MSEPNGFMVGGKMYPAKSIRLEMAMSDYIAELEQQLAVLREALETISRLEPYDGNRHVYHTAGKVARKALAALQESSDE